MTANRGGVRDGGVEVGRSVARCRWSRLGSGCRGAGRGRGARRRRAGSPADAAIYLEVPRPAQLLDRL